MNPPPPPKLSIIMPVYNVRQYLDEAIDSVLDQDFADFELLLIDDGSTDGSGDLAEERAKSDPRIRVIHQENGGLANARNTGVSEASGEYIAFLDSDDAATKTGYSTMINTLNETGSDYITGQMHMWRGVRKRKSDLHRRSHDKWRKRTNLSEHPDIVFDSTVTNKVIRRSFWTDSGAYFPEGKLYEDFIPSTILFTKAAAFDVMPTAMYAWRIRDEGGSITQQRHEMKNLRDRFEMTAVVRQMVKETPNNGPAISALNYKNVWVDLNLYRPWKFGSTVTDEYREEWLKGARGILSEVKPDDLKGLETRMKLEMYLVSQDRYDDVLRLQTWYNEELAGSPAIDVSPGKVTLEKTQLPFNADDIPDWVLDCTGEVQPEGWIESVDWISPSSFKIKGRAYSTKAAPATDQEVSLSLVAPSSKAKIELASTPIDLETANTRTKDDVADHARAGFECIVDLNQIPDNSKNEKWIFQATVSSLFGKQKLNLPFTKSKQGRLPSVPVEHRGFLNYFTLNTRNPMRLVIAKQVARIANISSDDASVTVEFIGRGSRRMSKAWLVVEGSNEKTSMSLRKVRNGVQAVAPVPGDPNATWSVLTQKTFGKPAQATVDQNSTLGSSIVSVPNINASVFRIINSPISVERFELSDPGELMVTFQGLSELDLEVGLGFDEASVRNWVDLPRTSRSISVPLTRAGYDGIVRPTKSGTYLLYGRDRNNLTVPFCVPAHIDSFQNTTSNVTGNETVYAWANVDATTQQLSVTIRPALTDGELTRYGKARTREFWLKSDSVEPLDTVLFYDFFGRAQIDSSYYVFQELKKRRLDVECYFAVEDPSVPVPEGARPVLINSERWFELQQRSRYIFSNITLNRTLPKPEFQTFVQLWHGTPLKHIGATVWRKSGSQRLLVQDKESNDWDFLVSQSPFETDLLRDAFLYDGDILTTGYPRNDPLYNAPPGTRERCLAELGVDPSHRVLLFAPTYRDTQTVSGFSATMPEIIDFDKLIRSLDQDWTVLVRGHGVVAASGQVLDYGDRVIDVTQAPNINDLYLASDLLVTDYSSALFDYSVTGKPFLLYTPDLEEYRETRGLYVDLDEFSPTPLLRTEVELAKAANDIESLADQYRENFEAFRATYVPWDRGTASSQIIDAVFR